MPSSKRHTREIDSLLVATLDVDDFVDLEELRVTPEHPAFEAVT